MADNLTPEILEREYSIEELEERLTEKEARDRAAIENELAGLNASPVSDPAPREDDGVFGNTYEIVGSAIEQGAEQIVRTVGDLGTGLEDFIDPEKDSFLSGRFVLTDFEEAQDVGVGLPFTDYRVAFMNRKEFDQLETLYELKTGGVSRNLSNLDFPDVDRPDSTAGQITSDIVRWALVFAATRKSLGSAQTKAGATALGVTAGALTDFTAFDPHEARLSDLLITLGEGNPVFDNAVTEYLAADVTDSAIEGRLKNAVEGAVVGGLVETVFRGIKWLRVRRTRRSAQQVAEDSRPVPPRGDDAVDTPRQTPEEAQQARIDEIDQRARQDANEAATEAVRAENVVEAAARQLRSKQDVPPELRNKLAVALKEGRLSEAEDLLTFNSDTFDWEGLAGKLESSEDADVVRQIINTTSEVFATHMDEAQGYQSLAETLRKGVGGTVDDLRHLHADVTGGKGIAARMAGARALMTSSADKLRVLAKAAARDGATQADEVALFRHIEVDAVIQAQVKGAGSEIARALHAMRSMKAATAESFREFDNLIREIGGRNPELRKQLARRIAEARDLNDIHKIVRKSKWRRALDMSVEVYVNGLLSSLSTLTLNNTSNALKVLEGITERYFAVGLGAMRNGVRRGLGLAPLERVALREANAYALGTIKGLDHAVRIPLMEIIKDVGKSAASVARRDIEAAGLSWDSAVRGVEEGSAFKAFINEQPQIDVLQRVDADTRKAINTAGDGLDAKAVRLIGKVIRMPSRLILGSDEFFKSIGFHQELYARSYRRAAALADEGGLTGTRREKFVAKEVQIDLLDPSEDLHFEAMDFARYQTFQADLEGSFAKGIEDFINRHPVMKFVVPFYRTPVNIVKQTILERSPLGFVKLHHSKLWRQIAKGGPEGDIALARLATGSAFIGMGMTWAMGGLITGSGSSNVALRNTEELDGIPPYSVKIGDKWYQYNRLEPLGMLMGLAADLAEAAISWDPDEDAAPFWEASIVALTVVTTNITDKTWFKGVSDLITAMDDPKRYLENYAENLGSTAVLPYNSLLRRINAEHDQYAREAWTFFDKWRRNIPGLSQDLPIARDYLGNPRTKLDYFGAAWISPFATGVESDDPVYRELARLGFDYRMPRKDVFGIGEDVDAETYSEFLRIRGTSPLDNGRSLQQTLREFIQSPEYQFELSDLGREERITEIVGRFTRAARQQMVGNDFSLQLKVEQAKTRARQDLLSIPE